MQHEELGCVLIELVCHSPTLLAKDTRSTATISPKLNLSISLIAIMVGWFVPILRSEAQTEREAQEVIPRGVDAQCIQAQPPSLRKA